MSLTRFADTVGTKAVFQVASREHITLMQMSEKATLLDENCKKIIRLFCYALITISFVGITEGGNC